MGSGLLWGKVLGLVLSRDREAERRERFFPHRDKRVVVQGTVVSPVEGLPATSDEVLNNLF